MLGRRRTESKKDRKAKTDHEDCLALTVFISFRESKDKEIVKETFTVCEIKVDLIKFARGGKFVHSVS